MTRFFEKSSFLVLFACGALWSRDGLAETIYVKTTALTGPASLFEAIEKANEDPGHTEIRFHLPVPDPAPTSLEIYVDAVLPQIASPVTIDGSTQPASAVLLVNETPLPVLDLIGGSEGSTVRGLRFASPGGGAGILVEANSITMEELAFSAVPHGIQLIDHESIDTPWGGELKDIAILHSSFLRTVIWSEALLSYLTFVGNDLLYSQFQASSTFGLETRDSVFVSNSFRGWPSSFAIRLMHASRCRFEGNSIRDFTRGIILSGFGGTIGNNSIVGNKFLNVETGVLVANKNNTRNTFSRNVYRGGTGEPFSLSPLVMADWGDPTSPNAGKGRPSIDGSFFSGSPSEPVLVLYGTTHPGQGNDIIEVFTSDEGYSYSVATGYLAVQVDAFVTNAVSDGAHWLASIPVEQLPEHGQIELTVSATDPQGNTSEFAIPHSVFVP